MRSILALCLLMVGVSVVTPLRAQTTKPEGQGPFPVIVILHSTQGVTSAEKTWADRLSKAGYVAHIVDSGGVNKDNPLAVKYRREELAKAVEKLRQLPYVNPDRIGLLGRSHGSWVALASLQEEYAKGVSSGLRAVVAFYPLCSTDNWAADVPVLLLLGAWDTVTRAGPCEELAARQKGKGLPVRAITYPGASHFFDMVKDTAGDAAEKEVLGFFSENLKN